MVFFTCNHCGESLKKQAVEKHYQWKSCKGAQIFVSCHDCQKDFRDQEFTAHTKCISEAEKYSGKDYVAKPSQNKGQRKQEAWTEIIQKILDRKDLIPPVRNLVNLLTKHENVPRKRPKFVNFMKNVSRHTSPKDVDRVFDLIEEAHKAEKETQTPVQNGKKEETNPTENGEEKSQKRKSEEEETEEPVKKKKKKDKKSEENESESNKNKVEKSKKKKNKKTEEENNSQESQDVEMETDEKPGKKSKKNKTKTNGSVEVEEEHKTEEIIENGKEKKKSKKKKNSESEEVQTLPGKVPFPWKETIKTILSEKNNKMSLEKFKKKLLKEYKTNQNEDASEEINKDTIDVVLKRKLKKMKNVSIEDDKVILAA